MAGALTLAAGKGGYPVILPVGKPDAFEGLPRQPQRLRPVHPGDERLHGHIFLGGKLGQQVVELEDEPKLFVAEMGFFHGVMSGRLLPSNNTLPAVGVSSAPSRWRRVDLPDPDAPTMARDSPARTVRSIFFRMVMRSAGPSQDFSTPESS